MTDGAPSPPVRRDLALGAGAALLVLALNAGYVSAHLGSVLLIFAFIVTVIGGLGSLTGAALAAVLVAVPQQFANYYWGIGDVIAVLALAVVLLVRPSGLRGARA